MVRWASPLAVVRSVNLAERYSSSRCSVSQLSRNTHLRRVHPDSRVQRGPWQRIQWYRYPRRDPSSCRYRFMIISLF